MPDTLARYHKALRLIFLLNVPCLALVLGMMWVSHHKAAAAAASRASFAPMDARVRDLIESERDIEKLRNIARIENIGASGSVLALLYMSKESTKTLLPAALMCLVSITIAGVSLRKSAKSPPVAPSS